MSGARQRAWDEKGMIEVMAPGHWVLREQSTPATIWALGRRVLWLAVILVVLFAAMADRAWTQTPSLWQGYTVENIETKAVAGTGAEAQEQAFRNARVAGLREVASRLVCPENQAQLRIPADSQLEAMVQSTELTDQKIIGSSYSGLLNIAFDPGAVGAYLSGQRVPHATGPAPRQLAIPILREEGSPALTFDDNPWLRIWSRGPDPTLLQTYDLMRGDEQDRAIFDPEVPSRSAVLSLMEKYDFAAALVIQAQLTPPLDEEAPASLYVEAIRIGDGPGEVRLEANLVAETDESIDSLLRRGAFAIQEQASAAYCRTFTAAPVALPTTIQIVVIGMDYNGWLQAEALLSARQEIRGLTFMGQREGAFDVSVEFVGGLLDLQQVFRSVRLRFEAYTAQAVVQDAMQVYFFAQPDVQPPPTNVRILPLNDIQLSN